MGFYLINLEVCAIQWKAPSHCCSTWYLVIRCCKYWLVSGIDTIVFLFLFLFFLLFDFFPSSEVEKVLKVTVSISPKVSLGQFGNLLLVYYCTRSMSFHHIVLQIPGSYTFFQVVEWNLQFHLITFMHILISK